MKKLGKFLTLLLSLALVATALVVIGAADNTAASDKNWVVDGVEGEDGAGGFDSLASAITAAGGSKAVKLNKDLEIDADLSVSASAVIDMNGHTITETRTTNANAAVFSVSSNGTSFELKGTGSFVNCSRWIYLNANFSGITVTLNGTGTNGITVTMNSSTTVNEFKLITLEERCSTMTVKGKITVTPYGHSDAGNQYNYVFSLGSNSTALGTLTTELVLDGATFVVEVPSNDGDKTDANIAIYFANLLNGSKVTVKNNSFINMKHGNVFNFVAATALWNQTAYYSTETGTVGQITSVESQLNPQTATKSVWIDVDDSKIYAYQSGWCTVTNYSNAGILFNAGASHTSVTVDNSELGGACRTIAASANYKKPSDATYAGQGNVFPSVFIFNNVDYVYDTTSKYGSSWLITGGVNIKWNGGIIYNPSMIAGDSYAYSELDYDNDGAPDAWFGVRLSNVYLKSDGWNSEVNGVSRVNAFTRAGTKYTNVKALKNGAAVTMNAAYFDEEPTTVITADSMSSVVGYDVDYKNHFTGTRKFSPLENGHIWSKTLSTGVTTPWRYGRYVEVAGENNGYIKFVVDEATVRTNGETIPTDQVTNPVAGTEYKWNPDGHSNPYLALLYGGNTRYVSGGSAAENPIQSNAFFVHEFDLATDTGKYPQMTVAIYARYGNYTYTKGADGALNYNTAGDFTIKSYQFFSVSDTGALTNNCTTKSSASFSLSNTGEWTRVTIVYQIVKTETTVTPIVGDDTTTVNAYDFSGSKAHVYIDGVWFGTLNLFGDVDPLPCDEVNGKSASQQFGFDQLRFAMNYLNREAGTSICFDNDLITAHKTANNAALTAIASNANVNLNDYKQDMLIMPAAPKLTLPGATVIWQKADGNEIGRETVETGASMAPSAAIVEAAGGSTTPVNGWYDLGLCWAQGGTVVDPAAMTATSGATYTFKATTAPKAPASGVAGIKLNLTLYTDFELNIFIPNEGIPANISNVNLAGGGIKKGTFKQTDGTFSTNGIVTIAGTQYVGYTARYGVADADIDTYKLSYDVTIDGVTTTVVYDINYGIPAYASQVMHETTQDETVKTLVMNMVNYADLVIRYSGTSTSTAGYRIYSGLLANEDCKAFVTELDDALFLEGGDIYTSSVAPLNYNNKDATGSNGEYWSSHFLAGAGFYFSTERPEFYVQYDGAVAAEYSWTYSYDTVTVASDGSVTRNENAGTATVKGGIATNNGYWTKGIHSYVSINGAEGRPAPAGRPYAYTDRVGGTPATDFNDYENNIYVQFATQFGTPANGTAMSNNYQLFKLTDITSFLNIEVVDNNGVVKMSKTDITRLGINDATATALVSEGVRLINPVTNDDGTVTYEVHKQVSKVHASVKYSLAGYINGMLTSSTATGDEYAKAAELAKALYAYAESAKAYVNADN